MHTEELNFDYRPMAVIDDIDNITHEEWLVSRMKGIGGSDAGAILGVNRYTSPYEVALKKIGVLADTETSPEQQYTLDFGHSMEPLMLDYYQKITGFRVFTDRAQYCHPDYPFMLADCDGFAELPDGQVIGLELKTYNYEQKALWKSGVYGKDGIIKNPEYAVQVAHYMSVMNLERFDLLAQCGNSAKDMVIVTFYRDCDFEAYMITEEKRFWENLEAGILPPAVTVGERSYERIVDSLTEKRDAGRIELPDTVQENLEEIRSLQEEKSELNAQIKKLEERLNAVRIPVIEALGGHEEGKCGKYIVTFRGAEKSSVDADRFRLTYPELYPQFLKTALTKPVMRIKEERLRK